MNKKMVLLINIISILIVASSGHVIPNSNELDFIPESNSELPRAFSQLVKREPKRGKKKKGKNGGAQPADTSTESNTPPPAEPTNTENLATNTGPSDNTAQTNEGPDLKQLNALLGGAAPAGQNQSKGGKNKNNEDMAMLLQLLALMDQLASSEGKNGGGGKGFPSGNAGATAPAAANQGPGGGGPAGNENGGPGGPDPQVEKVLKSLLVNSNNSSRKGPK